MQPERNAAHVRAIDECLRGIDPWERVIVLIAAIVRHDVRRVDAVVRLLATATAMSKHLSEPERMAVMQIMVDAVNEIEHSDFPPVPLELNGVTTFNCE